MLSNDFNYLLSINKKLQFFRHTCNTKLKLKITIHWQICSFWYLESPGQQDYFLYHERAIPQIYFFHLQVRLGKISIGLVVRLRLDRLSYVILV